MFCAAIIQVFRRSWHVCGGTANVKALTLTYVHVRERACLAFCKFGVSSGAARFESSRVGPRQ